MYLKTNMKLDISTPCTPLDLPCGDSRLSRGFRPPFTLSLATCITKLRNVLKKRRCLFTCVTIFMLQHCQTHLYTPRHHYTYTIRILYAPYTLPVSTRVRLFQGAAPTGRLRRHFGRSRLTHPKSLAAICLA